MLSRIERLLHRERNAIAMGHRDLMALPVEERIERGDSLGGLRWAGEGSGGAIRLRCRENLAKFRTGDPLRLRPADATPATAGIAVVYESHDDATGIVTVTRDTYRTGGRIDSSGELQLDPEATSLVELALEALGRMRTSTAPAVVLARRMLEGTAAPERDHEAFRAGFALAESTGALDRSQCEAFASAFSDTPFALVQGPPGTGKTQVLARAACRAARLGERVLVTAYTHRAVNHALAKIADADPSLDVVKVGKPSGRDGLARTGVGAVSSMRRLPPADGRPRVVGATIFSLRGAWGDGTEDGFDRVVFDEAAQIPLAYAPMGLLAGKRFLFVGDHAQLGPIIQGEHDDPLAARSIFEHLAALYPSTMLRTTYRLNDGLHAFPSREFYGGRLAPSDPAGGARFGVVTGGSFDPVFDPDAPVVFAGVHHEGFRTRALPEAAAVADLAYDLLARQGLPSSELAIVSPYRAQLRLIRRLLRSRLDQAGGASLVLPVIDTVERIQGQEREAVLVSLTASDPEVLAGEQAAFFYSPNRLNVTLTRARTKLVLVGSKAAFEAFPSRLEDLLHADLFRRLRRSIPEIDLSARYLP